MRVPIRGSQIDRDSLQDVENVGREVKGRMKFPVAIAINHVADKLVFFIQIERPMEVES